MATDNNPKSDVWRTLLELEAAGLIERIGFRDGKVVWRATPLGRVADAGITERLSGDRRPS